MPQVAGPTAGRGVARRNRRAAEVQGPAGPVQYHLYDIRIAGILRDSRAEARVATSSFSALAATARMWAGSTRGASPCRFTTTSPGGNCNSSATSATRSEPQVWSGRVIRAAPPNSSAQGGHALVVGGDRHRPRAGFHGPPPNVLDQRPSGNRLQRLPRQPAGGKTRGNHDMKA